MNSKLKADEDLIRWLLDNSGMTIYRISKDSGIPVMTITDLARGNTSMEKITFKTASDLTEFASKKKPL